MGTIRKRESAQGGLGLRRVHGFCCDVELIGLQGKAPIIYTPKQRRAWTHCSIFVFTSSAWRPAAGGAAWRCAAASTPRCGRWSRIPMKSGVNRIIKKIVKTMYGVTGWGQGVIMIRAPPQRVKTPANTKAAAGGKEKDVAAEYMIKTQTTQRMDRKPRSPARRCFSGAAGTPGARTPPSAPCARSRGTH